MLITEINHEDHLGHKLKLKWEDMPYRCDGCKELGFGMRFTCEEAECNFHLHKDCAQPRDAITHSFFPKCNLIFIKSGDLDRYCDACGGDIKGFVYHCFVSGCDLHPCCANLPQELLLEEDKMKLELKKKMSSKCNKCGKKELRKGARSWSYKSTCKGCHLHVSCAKDLLHESWENVFFLHTAKSSLAFQSKTPTLGITLPKKKSKTRWFPKFAKIAKIAITFIIAAVLGDPTAIVVGLITSLFNH